MSLRERLARWVAPRDGLVRQPDPSTLIHTPWAREAGVRVTASTAVQVSAVYGCARLIVDSLAAAPIRVFEKIEMGQRREVFGDPIADVLNDGAGVERFPGAPTAQAIEEGVLWPALTGDGNGYAEIQRSGSGDMGAPVALWPLPPGLVTPKHDSSGALYYEIGEPGGTTKKLSPMRVFHLRGPSLAGWVGDSTVYNAAKSIGIAQAAQVFAAAYYANGTVLSGLLASDKMVSQEQADRAREEWGKRHGGGPARAHGIAVTGQGLKYQPIGHDAQQSQLIESRRFQVAEIARFYGVPLSLLAENEAWTNLSELYLGFYRNALLPWASRFDAEAQRKLYPLGKKVVEHDLTRLVMGSFKDQIAALKEAVGAGLKSRNEARAILGDNSIGPDGDSFKPAAPPSRFKVTPAEDPGEEDEEGAKPSKPPGGSAARAARAAVSLDRFERAISARRRDMERNAPDKVAANVAELRAKLEPGLIAECRAATGDNSPGMDMRVRTIADAVLAGEPAHLAALRLTEA
jgi:HK97 family phage portal protein